MALIGNVSGSLTKTVDGRGYIRPGANITITSGTFDGANNQHFITIAGAAASSIAADNIGAGDAAVNIATTSGNITIDAQANDADVIIKVDDNGSAVTAVTFDGSDEGNAIFVNDLKLQSDAAAIHFGANDDIVLTHEADRGIILTQATETTGEPVFTIKNTGNLASGGGIEFILDNGAGEGDDDVLGFLSFKGDDGGDAETQFASMQVLASDITAGDESGQFIFSTFAGGTAGTAAIKQILNIGGEDVANGSPCEVVINEESIDVDFRVESNNHTHALHLDGGNDRIALFADCDDADVDQDGVTGIPGNAKFFVSGTKSATSSANGPDNSGGSHFGGDIIVSGNLYNGGITYANTVVAGASITASTKVFVGSNIEHLGDTDTTIAFAADSMTTTVGAVEFIKITEDGSQDKIEYNSATADVDFIFDNANAEVLSITAAGVVINEGAHATNDTRIETDNLTHAVFVDGGEDQVILGADGTNDDVFFFVSGSTATPNSTEGLAHKGVALFGGSIVISGSLQPGLDNTVDLGGASNRFANIYTGDLHLKNDRGDWTMIEEATYMSLRNNATGKLYKLLMEEIEE